MLKWGIQKLYVPGETVQHSTEFITFCDYTLRQSWSKDFYYQVVLIYHIHVFYFTAMVLSSYKTKTAVILIKECLYVNSAMPTLPVPFTKPTRDRKSVV